jgi:hypothetical protein
MARRSWRRRRCEARHNEQGETNASPPAPDGDQTVRRRGDLRAAIRPMSIPWPADEPVRLRFADGAEFEVWLEPDVLEQGPVLLQVARVSPAANH